jgi:methyl-accepting chemotaxis protein
VSQSVDTTRTAAQDSQQAVAELDETARRLTALVDRFKV